MAAQPDHAARPFAAAAVSTRTVKSFDFDEEPLGNFEPTPMNWKPIAARGFPPFQRALLDKQVGRAAAPSMRLSITVGSSGVLYSASDIPVAAGCDYRIRAWIRTDHLSRAAATIRATLFDSSGSPIPGSSRDSSPLRSADSSDDWRRVEIIVPNDAPGARFIQLAALVTQPETPSTSVRLEDTYAGAWFDDIEVDRLPRVAFIAQPGDEILQSASPELRVSIHDTDTTDLAASITIADAVGRQFLDAPLKMHDASDGQWRIPAGPLPTGWYRATLTVSAADGPLRTAERIFIRDAASPRPTPTRSFLSLTLPSAPKPSNVAPLLAWLAPSAVSIPLAPQRGREPLLSAIRADQRAVVVQVSPTTQPDLTDALMRYAPMIDAWQLTAPQSTLAATIRRLAGPSPIALSCDISTELKIPAAAVGPKPEILNVSIPNRVPTARIAAQFAHFNRTVSPTLWAELPAPPSADAAATADWIKRILLAYQAGADRVFVPAPWNPETVAPHPHALALRALSALVASQRPVRTFDLDDAIHAALFADPAASTGTLVAWADDAADSPRRLDLPLGRAARAFDIEGRPIPNMNADSGFWLTDAPTYVTNVIVPQLVFADAATFEGLPLEVGRESQSRTLRFRNPTARRLETTLKLTAPTGWQLNPRSFKLTLAPGATTTAPVDFRLPRNAPAGPTPIPVELTLGDGSPPLHLTAPVTVGLADLDVRVLWRIDSGRLIIQQLVTNRANQPVSLRAVVRSPNHPRETRSIENLDPGRTAIREFVLDNAASLLDRSVRVTLARAGGSELANHIIRVESTPGLGHER